RNRQGRQVRWLRGRHHQCRTQQILQRRQRDARVMTASEPHPLTGQPIGLRVENKAPAPRPGPVTLKGRYGHLEKLTPEHATDLWAVFAGHDRLWTYISTDGPFANL